MIRISFSLVKKFIDFSPSHSKTTSPLILFPKEHLISLLEGFLKLVTPKVADECNIVNAVGDQTFSLLNPLVLESLPLLCNFLLALSFL
jgi:hypothetical protein